MYICIVQVVSVFENLHQGRILCTTMAEDNMLLTGGDSTVCACVHTYVTLSIIMYMLCMVYTDCVCLGDKECRFKGTVTSSTPIEAHPPWSH